MSARSPASARARAGFTLLETLVALAILGTVLLFTMSLIAQEPLVERRLRAHAEALDVLDTVHEAVRGGLPLALTPDLVDWQALYDPPWQPSAAERLTVSSEVERLYPDGLYRLTLRARYAVGPRVFDHELETMVWRP